MHMPMIRVRRSPQCYGRADRDGDTQSRSHAPLSTRDWEWCGSEPMLKAYAHCPALGGLRVLHWRQEQQDQERERERRRLQRK